jgi:hypothetical protein
VHWLLLRLLQSLSLLPESEGQWVANSYRKTRSVRVAVWQSEWMEWYDYLQLVDVKDRSNSA